MSLRWFLVVLLLLVLPGRMTAQEAGPSGTLRVMVRDPSGAVIAGATVVVTATGLTRTGRSSGEGVAVVDGLPPGRYTLRVDYDGFETVEIRGYRVRAGNNHRDVTMPLASVTEDVDVERDRQEAALDTRGSAFSTLLTREQIDALPDDPDEMEAVLRALSPTGSTIRVDGFSGGRLPPKAQIRSIRLPRGDSFAAESHGGLEGASFIDIVTQPGLGRLGGAVDSTFRDGRLNAANPFTPEKGREDLRQYGLSFSGPVVAGRSSFSVSSQMGTQRDAVALFAALPRGTQSEAVLQRTRPSSLFARFDQAIGAARMLRATYAFNGNTRHNLGTGGFDLPDRAYDTSSREHLVRVSESGPVGRNIFSDLRLQLTWSSDVTSSRVEAPTTRVLDSFTSGGAQQDGGRRSLDVQIAGDVDVVRGAHSYRAGVLLEGGRYRSDRRDNYLGTWTYSSLDDYEAGRPSHFSQRTGDADVRDATMRLGAYVQDDFRVARSLLVSFGVRYEMQSYSSDRFNLSPRITLAWAPRRSGRTTVRAAAGRFTDWIPSSAREQAQLVDGERFREISITNPTFDDADGTRPVQPSNRYLLERSLALPETDAVSVGVSQALVSDLRVSATWVRRFGRNLLRGVDRNAPNDGVRPDPRYADVVAATGDAAARGHVLMFDASFARPRWHRLFAGVNYAWSTMATNSTGVFSRAASRDLDDEWGPMGPGHRLGASFIARFGALGVTLNARALSGMPYTLTSGIDSNRDGVFNDRPEGVARNSLRTPATWDIGGRLSYVIGFGRSTAGGGRGGGAVVIVREDGGAAMPGGFDGGREDARVRLEFYVSVQNITNRANYTGYSGVATSPFFQQPTNVMNPRKVQLGVRTSF